MEYWLLSYDGKDSLHLPVPPENVSITTANGNTTVTIITAGELNLIGKSKLATLSLSAFFPAQEYSFCQYTGFPAPYDCASKIEGWRTSGRPIRLIITDTNINMAMTIETFTYGEQDGTGDVYFTLELKEYRYVSIQTVSAAASSSAGASSGAAKARPATKTVPKTYVVKKGDTLWTIAKRLTGNGSNYKSIAAKNGIKNPNVIHVGQKLVI